MSSTYNPERYDNNIILTRVRLARNVAGVPFIVKDKKVSKEIIKSVYLAVNKVEKFDLFYLKDFSPLRREALKERHLISNYLMNNSEHSAVLLNKDESLSVMIHEEDVLRSQCFMRCFSPYEAYKRLSRLDDEIAKKLNYAYDNKLGYLTSCPTNVGTGLRASVMLFLPALTETGKIKQVIEKVEYLGLTVRGVYGEGSKADGFTYQISNEVTLGVTEEEIISKVSEAVLTVCEAERQTLERYFSVSNANIRKVCFEAMDSFETAKSLSYETFIDYISRVRLGVSLGLFSFKNPEAIDDLIITARPANLCEYFGKNLSPEERDVSRGYLVRNSLKIIKGEYDG